MGTIILSALIIIMLGFLFNKYRKSLESRQLQDREEQRKHRVHSEIMSRVRSSARTGLTQTNELKSSHLGSIRLEMAQLMSACVLKYIETADGKILTIMNGKFYEKATYAALPRKKWKVEFQDACTMLNDEVVDQRALGRELGKIVRDAENKLRGQLLSILDTLHIEEEGLSVDAQQALSDFKNNPNKAIQWIGKDGELDTLLNLNVKRDASIALGLFSSSAAFHIASQTLNVETVTALTGGIMKDIFGSELLRHATTVISDWLVQEVGEQAITELLEALAIAATGLGIPFTVYKVYKYWRVVDRLFIEKEPLEKMRRAVRESVKDTLTNVAESVEHSAIEQMEDWITDVESQLRKIMDESTFQEINSRSHYENIGPSISFA